MADQDYQAQEGEERPRKSFQQFPQRANASSNWRMKDDTPRTTDAQPRPSPRGGFQGQGRSFDSPSRSYNNQGPRETSDTRLYVGNLLYSASRNDVEQFFTANGFAVSGISMSIDPATGRNPSYCFVDFESADEASRAMADLNGAELLGRGVRINLGVARQGGSGAPREGKPAFGSREGGERRGWGQGNGESRTPKVTLAVYRTNTSFQADSTSSPSTNRWNRNEGSTYHSTVTTSNNDTQSATKRLYIGNLPLISPQSSIEEAIQSLFSPLGIEIVTISKLISPHESKKDLPGDHHYLFVDLAKAEDAEIAIESLDGPGKIEAEWVGREGLKVNKARENDRRRQERGGWQSRGDREGGSGYQPREPREGGYQPREPREGGYQQREGGYQSRRTEGFRDWRKTERQDE